MKNTKEFPFAVGVPSLLWQVLFFYLPLGLLVLSSFLKVNLSGAVEGFTLEHFFQFLTPTYMKVIGASLLLALSNAMLCFLLAFPLAYFLTFTASRFRNFFLFLLIVPFWTNFLLHVYAWFYVLEYHGILNTLLLKMGLLSTPLRLLNTPFAIMIMMVYYYLPFMVLPIYTSLDKFNPSLMEASYDLGGNFLHTLRKILIPLSSPGIRGGFFLVFIPSFGEFAIPELMGGDKNMFVGTVVSQYILGEGTGSLGAAFTLISALCLILSSVLLYFVLTKLLSPRRSLG